MKKVWRSSCKAISKAGHNKIDTGGRVNPYPRRGIAAAQLRVLCVFGNPNGADSRQVLTCVISSEFVRANTRKQSLMLFVEGIIVAVVVCS